MKVGFSESEIPSRMRSFMRFPSRIKIRAGDEEAGRGTERERGGDGRQESSRNLHRSRIEPVALLLRLSLARALVSLEQTYRQTYTGASTA
mgnify:CR=1 FL=1